jgi:hypothetical protein
VNLLTALKRTSTSINQALCRHNDYIHFTGDGAARRMHLRCVKCKRETPGWVRTAAKHPEKIRRLPGKPEVHRLGGDRV